ncbi:serine/threonine protein kinase, partial [candidate division CSSED10-310 bacterium]
MTERPDSIGEFRIVETLGRGGMGIVYHAIHESTGESVALKTIRLPRVSLLQSIRREIHTLTRLRHPGIIRIVADGVYEGLPWYAMELLQGITLRHYFTRSDIGSEDTDTNIVSDPRTTSLQGGEDAPASKGWWTHSLNYGDETEEVESTLAFEGSSAIPERVSNISALSQEILIQILTIIRRLCFPLAFLHGEGIIHRDIKPDNIIVKPDGTPVLVDFGLISHVSGEISRELLSVEHSEVGTALYMAPEQIQGSLGDCRIDLYALGCLLFELLTGVPPYDGETVTQILRCHILEKPRAPSQLRPGLPTELDNLVLRLLAKEPRQRIGYALDVAHILARLGAQYGVSASEL